MEEVTRKEEDLLKVLVMKLGGDPVPLDGLDQVISVGDLVAYWSTNGYPSTYRVAKVMKIKIYDDIFRKKKACRIVVRSVYIFRDSGEFSRPPQLSKRNSSLESLHKVIVVKPDMVRPDVVDILSKVV